MKITTRLLNARFTLEYTIEDRDGVQSIKDLKVYSIDKNADLCPFLSDNAIFMLKQEISKVMDIDDLTG
jgi:hypothetical protein